MRERLLITYGSTLLGQRGLWQVAVDYFTHCGIFAEGYIQECIERQPIESDTKVDKLLRFAKTPQQQRNICRVYAANQHIKGRYAACVSGLLLSGDSERLGCEIDWILSNIDRVAKFLPAIASSAAVLDASSPISSTTTSKISPTLFEPRLVFLQKYHQLLNARKMGDISTQARVLSQLLTNKIAPFKFWASLLLDCVPLLENVHNNTPSQPLFDAHETCQLMACVEDFVLEYLSFPNEEKYEVTEAQLETVRLALSRNLAKVIV